MIKRLQLIFLILFFITAYFLLAIEPVGSVLAVSFYCIAFSLSATVFVAVLISTLPFSQGAGKHFPDKQESVLLFITNCQISNFIRSVFFLWLETDALITRSLYLRLRETKFNILNKTCFRPAPCNTLISFFNKAVESFKIQRFFSNTYLYPMLSSAIYGSNKYTSNNINLLAAHICLNFQNPYIQNTPKNKICLAN